MKKKEAVLISAYTGFLLTKDFSDVHKFITETLDRPVYTHELGNREIQDEIREKLKPQIIEMIRGEK